MVLVYHKMILASAFLLSEYLIVLLIWKDSSYSDFYTNGEDGIVFCVYS